MWSWVNKLMNNDTKSAVSIISKFKLSPLAFNWFRAQPDDRVSKKARRSTETQRKAIEPAPVFKALCKTPRSVVASKPSLPVSADPQIYFRGRNHEVLSWIEIPKRVSAADDVRRFPAGLRTITKHRCAN